MSDIELPQSDSPEMLHRLLQECDPTSFDLFLSEQVEPITSEEVKLDKDTLLFVIDMQNDFVSGSFCQPCQQKQDALTKNLAELIKVASEKDSTIMVSLDFHSEEHCSFKESCANEFHFFPSKEEGKRYRNRFPKHCVYTVSDDGKVSMKKSEANSEAGVTEAFYGAELQNNIRQSLQTASQRDSTKVVPLFKGFNDDIDSFAAFPHLKDDGTFEKFTGGYFREGSEGSDCFSHAATGGMPAACLPTKDEMATLAGLTSVDTLLDRADFKRVIVTGLVYDFCVKESAMALSRYFQHKEKSVAVFVVADLARPALEGVQAAGPDPYSVAEDLHKEKVALTRWTEKNTIVKAELKARWEKSTYDLGAGWIVLICLSMLTCMGGLLFWVLKKQGLMTRLDAPREVELTNISTVVESGGGTGSVAAAAAIAAADAGPGSA
mmetsp:Transcript_41367/g.89451  ORF Transcript_41367/g.89451 Transcript_41367/m.89451 type:complete len:436 (+) Transcript_41367:156-1463(+)